MSARYSAFALLQQGFAGQKGWPAGLAQGEAQAEL